MLPKNQYFVNESGKPYILSGLLWEQRDSNPRPSACKADALNQLSYAPNRVRQADVSPLTNECKCMQISKNPKHNPDIFSQIFIEYAG